MSCKQLLSKGKINDLVIRNRTVMVAMGNNFASESGDVSEDMLSYYVRRAQGGVGMIITEYCQVDSDWGVSSTRQLSLYSPQRVVSFEKLATEIHRYGATLLIQLQHPGAQTRSSLQEKNEIVAPSIINLVGEEARALTVEEIKKLIIKFANSAELAQRAGVDGVELHAGHGYLLNQFLSPKTNLRKDEYGGTTENRCRIIQEIVDAIREKCGDRFVISVRMPGEEYMPGGINTEEGLAIAKELDKMAIDLLNITSGTAAHKEKWMEPYFMEEGWRSYLAKNIRKEVKKPILAVNTIRHPDFAEKLLNDDVCDFVGLGRSLVADPDFVNKVKENSKVPIRPCIGCLYCHKEYVEGRRLKCAVNPLVGRENYFKESDANYKLNEPKRVLVIGSGPAGMVAAAELAKRNISVDLWEQRESLGGLLNYANKVPGKDLITELRDFLIEDMVHHGVNIEVGKIANEISVSEERYDAIIVATGGKPIVPKFLDLKDREYIYVWDEILSKEKKVQGKKIVVIGGGVTGLEVAEFIAIEEEDKEVIVLEMSDQFASGVSSIVQTELINKLLSLNIKLLPNYLVKDVVDDGLLCSSDNAEVLIEADSIVLATGLKPDLEENVCLEKQNRGETFFIGDAVKGRLIADAVREGFERAFDI